MPRGTIPSWDSLPLAHLVSGGLRSRPSPKAWKILPVLTYIGMLSQRYFSAGRDLHCAYVADSSCHSAFQMLTTGYVLFLPCSLVTGTYGGTS